MDSRNINGFKLIDGITLSLELYQSVLTDDSRAQRSPFVRQNEGRLLRQLQDAVAEYERAEQMLSYYQDLTNSILRLPREIRDMIYHEYFMACCYPDSTKIAHGQLQAFAHPIFDLAPTVANEAKQTFYKGFTVHVWSHHHLQALGHLRTICPDFRGTVTVQQQAQTYLPHVNYMKFTWMGSPGDLNTMIARLRGKIDTGSRSTVGTCIVLFSAVCKLKKIEILGSNGEPAGATKNNTKQDASISVEATYRGESDPSFESPQALAVGEGYQDLTLKFDGALGRVDSLWYKSPE